MDSGYRERLSALPLLSPLKGRVWCSVSQSRVGTHLRCYIVLYSVTGLKTPYNTLVLLVNYNSSVPNVRVLVPDVRVSVPDVRNQRLGFTQDIHRLIHRCLGRFLISAKLVSVPDVRVPVPDVRKAPVPDLRVRGSRCPRSGVRPPSDASGDAASIRCTAPAPARSSGRQRAVPCRTLLRRPEPR